MTGKEFQDAIDAIGMSQRAAATFLGLNERTVRYWVQASYAEKAIPDASAMLIGMLRSGDITIDQARAFVQPAAA